MNAHPQGLRSKSELRARAMAQISSSDYVPFGIHVSDTVIKLKDKGDYLSTWKLDGIAFETADPEDIHIWKEGLNNFIRSLGGGAYALWSHKIRRHVTERLDGDYDNSFCRDLNSQYYQSFETHRQMASELYLTVIYQPNPSGGARVLRGLGRAKSLLEQEAETLGALSHMDDIAKQVEASLKRYGPSRLGTETKGQVVYSQLLALFGYCLNGVWEDVPLKRMDIAEYLPTSRLHFGDKNGLLEIWHPSKRKFAGFLDFQDYPKWSEPGMCNAVLYGDYEYIETMSFSVMNRRDAMGAVERQKGHLIASEDAGQREIAEMDEAMDDLASGQMDLGEYHYSLALFGDTLDQVSKSMSEARALLQDGPGFKMAVIDAIPECAWFAQLPGNWSMRPREAKITSRNFACLSPYHNFARGKRHGNPWGEALALFKTPAGQPYYFNFHVSPEDRDSSDEKYPGNTFICGATGVGKTALELSLLAFATKYKDLRCVMFDKDRGAEIGIRAMGGHYFALKRAEPTGFNPLQLEPSEVNIQFCETLVRQLLRPAGEGAGRFSAKEEAEISQAVRTVMSSRLDKTSRSLTAVAQNLSKTGENSLNARLKKWLRGQASGWVFDNPVDTQDFSRGRIFGYDYTEFLDDPEIRTPVMAYLLHITESLIDGQPFIYVMEEFWKPLQDEMFSDFALNKQKTIRKQGGLGVFVTQSPSDVLTHRIGKTMVEQSVTQIFLPNPKADRADYIEGFKVTEAEYAIIRSLGETSRLFLVKQGQNSAIVRFDLGGMNDILNVVSGTTENVELLDQIRAEVGDNPEVWLPIFYQKTQMRRGQFMNGGTTHVQH